MLPVETIPSTWAEYHARLIPMVSKADIERVVGREVDLVVARHRLEELQVGLFHYDDPAFASYHLVQLGEDVPDCERLIGYRYDYDDSWYGPTEHAVSYFTHDTIIRHLNEEWQLRDRLRRFYETPQADDKSWVNPSQQAYWQVHKLTNLREARWAILAVRLQNLHDTGHSWQNIHNLFYHYDAWLATNPDFEGMPRELVLRAHGLAEATQTEYWLKLRAFGENWGTEAFRAHQTAAGVQA